VLLLIIFIIEFMSGFTILINIFDYLFYHFITKPTTKNYFVLTKLIIIRAGRQTLWRPGLANIEIGGWTVLQNQIYTYPIYVSKKITKGCL
jgi:hypothetical protein